MMNDLRGAKEQLDTASDLTLVLRNGDTVYTDTRRGITPMLELLSGRVVLTGFSVADRVVGRASALLFVRAGVCAVYARVVSEGALAVLTHYGIPCEYRKRVERIINREGTGTCPMESAVRDTLDPVSAEQILRLTMQKMQVSNTSKSEA